MKKLLSSSLLMLTAAVLLPALAAPAMAEDAAAAAADQPAAKQAAKPAKATKAKAGKPAAKAGTKAAGKESGEGQETVTPEVRDEMGKLVEQAVQVASPDLQTGDKFLPYGVLKMADGSLKIMRWEKPNPPPQMEVFKAIVISLMKEANRNPDVIATVSVAPSAVSQVNSNVPVLGIRAEVDHRHGAPQVVFIPFTHEGGKLILGTPIYTPGVNPIFQHGTPPAAAAAGAAPAAAGAAPAGSPTTAAPAAPAAATPAAAEPAKPAAPAKP